MAKNIPIIIISIIYFPYKTNQKMGILTGGRIYSLSPVAPQGYGEASINGYNSNRFYLESLMFK